MTSSDTHNTKPRASWIRILLFLAGLSLLSAVGARAQSVGGCVANFGGVIDGFVNPVPPTQINIDGNCTIRNFPASNPLTSNISFAGTGRGWLVIFDNVDFIGNLSCDKVHGNFIWFVNGSITRQHILNCANLFVPVDKIDKENPPGPPFVSIGVPFTYKLTFPQLVDATTGAVVNPNGSNAEVDQVTVTDNLNETGVSLSYVKSSAAWKGSGAAVPFTVTNASGLLTFSGFPSIPAGQQIVLSVTVVLNNAVPPNSPGTQFSNTANWTLGTTIGGTFHYPLPGQQGVSSPPLTIAAPNLVFTKSGPATMAVGQPGQFGFDILNNGTSDAWNATILDRLPKSAPTGGMCSATPQILSAQLFLADGVTPAKAPLIPNTDFSINYNGATCELTLTMLTAAGTIGANQHLIITYRTQLDANSQAGAQLTNVAGAIQWFNADPSVSTRIASTRTLTDGTPGVLDFQDAHTVTVVVNPLTITKQVSVVGGGPALPGGQLDYLVHVTNVSTNAVTPVVITDDLSTAGPGRLTLVNPPAATMNNSTAGVTIVGSLLTANYTAVNPPLPPGQTIDVRFRAQIAAGLPAGTTLTNTGVVTWNNPPETASASVSVDVGGVPGVGTLNGTAWLDANFNKVPDLDEPRLQGWTVVLFRNGVQLQSVLTDVNGVYRFGGVPPTDGIPDRYEVRFTAPGAGPNTAKLGKADSAFTNSLQRITDIAVPSGSNLQNLNLPIGPNGVVYNSLTRAPIAGMTVFMLNAGGRSPLPATCFDDPAQQGQITPAGGYYRFDLNFTDPACSSGSNFVIKVVAPSSTTFVAGESLVIPPASDASTAPFSVPTCPGSLQDALPSVPYCEAQDSEFAPAPSVAPRSTGTKYYLNLTLDGSSVPGSNQIYKNHIPVDPQIAGSFSMTKTMPLLNVTRGQLVPYTITVGSVSGASGQGVQLVDRYPAGFRYIPGSARLDGVSKEPTVAARQLVWNGLNFGSSDHRTIVLLLAVGAGVGEGE